MGMFDAYEGMKATKALEEYQASLLLAESGMFSEGSYIALCVDAAMSPHPKRAPAPAHDNPFVAHFHLVRGEGSSPAMAACNAQKKGATQKNKGPLNLVTHRGFCNPGNFLVSLFLLHPRWPECAASWRRPRSFSSS